jgi:hypothetical protein
MKVNLLKANVQVRELIIMKMEGYGKEYGKIICKMGKGNFKKEMEGLGMGVGSRGNELRKWMDDCPICLVARSIYTFLFFCIFYQC